jgi:hypothetical protein
MKTINWLLVFAGGLLLMGIIYFDIIANNKFPYWWLFRDISAIVLLATSVIFNRKK